jgi:hypothetical protein
VCELLCFPKMVFSMREFSVGAIIYPLFRGENFVCDLHGGEWGRVWGKLKN